MTDQHTNRDEERRREHATGHTTNPGRRQDVQTHAAQQRVGEQHQGEQEQGQQHKGQHQGQQGAGRQSERGREDTASLRRRYANTEQTQYGGNLADQPSAIEQTRTRENQSRTKGRVEGGNQHRRRYGSRYGHDSERRHGEGGRH